MNNQMQENARKEHTTTDNAVIRAPPNCSTVQNSPRTPIMVSTQAATPVQVPVVATKTPITVSTEVSAVRTIVTAKTPILLNLTKPMNQPNNINTPVVKPSTMNPPAASLPVNSTVPGTATNSVTTTLRISTPTLPQLLDLPNRLPMRNRAMSVLISESEYSAARPINVRRQSVCDNNALKLNGAAMETRGNTVGHTYSNNMTPNGQPMRKLLPKVAQFSQSAPTFMTKIHSRDLMQSLPPQTNNVQRSSQLKVLTPDDLNSSRWSIQISKQIQSFDQSCYFKCTVKSSMPIRKLRKPSVDGASKFNVKNYNAQMLSLSFCTFVNTILFCFKF